MCSSTAISELHIVEGTMLSSLCCILQVMWVEGGAAGGPGGRRGAAGRMSQLQQQQQQQPQPQQLMNPSPSTSSAGGDNLLASPSPVWPPAPWLALNNVYVGEMLHHRLLLEQRSKGTGQQPPEQHHHPHQCAPQTSCSICSLNL